MLLSQSRKFERWVDSSVLKAYVEIYSVMSSKKKRKSSCPFASAKNAPKRKKMKTFDKDLSQCAIVMFWEKCICMCITRDWYLELKVHHHTVALLTLMLSFQKAWLAWCPRCLEVQESKCPHWHQNSHAFVFCRFLCVKTKIVVTYLRMRAPCNCTDNRYFPWEAEHETAL